MKVYKPPTLINEATFRGRVSLGLFGSIEQGKAVDWQSQMQKQFDDFDIDIFNPRRTNWDSSWKQDKDNPQFRAQVEWELFALRNCNIRLFYFDPTTQSPITLMELGIATIYSCYTYVVCPDGFWRKGNVDLVCEHYGIHRLPTLDDARITITTTLSVLGVKLPERVYEIKPEALTKTLGVVEEPILEDPFE